MLKSLFYFAGVKKDIKMWVPVCVSRLRLCQSSGQNACKFIITISKTRSFPGIKNLFCSLSTLPGRAFAHGAMGHQIDPSWGGPIELFLVPASAPRLV